MNDEQAGLWNEILTDFKVLAWHEEPASVIRNLAEIRNAGLECKHKHPSLAVICFSCQYLSIVYCS
jgi:hypothetical protein